MSQRPSKKPLTRLPAGAEPTLPKHVAKIKVRTVCGERVHFACWRAGGVTVAQGLERDLCSVGTAHWRSLATALERDLAAWEEVEPESPGNFSRLKPAPESYWRAAGITPPVSA